MPTIHQAITHLKKTFPWPNYFSVGTDAHHNIATHIQKLLPTGAKILDVGCGPMDKTAVLAHMGYACTGADDLQDPWHQHGNNAQKIQTFAKENNIHFILDETHTLPVKEEEFDLAMACDVLEHLHNSPKDMLENMLTKIKPESYLLITVPNAVNLRKRLAVLRGKTNLPAYETYYWYPAPWRGHIREYTKDDLRQLAHFNSLNIITLKGADHMIAKLPQWAKPIYKTLTAAAPSLKDSWLLIAQKPKNWQPKPPPKTPIPTFVK